MRKLFAAVLLLSLVGCLHSAELEKQREKGAGTNYEYEGNTVRCQAAPLSFEITYLSPEQTDMYFSIYRGGRYKNPFPPSLIVFLLSIENKGKATATFNPGLAWMYPGKGSPSSAKDYTSLYTDLEFAKAEDLEERMEAFKASSFDGSESIPPGASVKKLIVFPRGKEKFDKAGIRLENVYAGKECSDVKFVFPGGLGTE